MKGPATKRGLIRLAVLVGLAALLAGGLAMLPTEPAAASGSCDPQIFYEETAGCCNWNNPVGGQYPICCGGCHTWGQATNCVQPDPGPCLECF